MTIPAERGLRLWLLLVAPLGILIALLAITPRNDLGDIASDLPIYLGYGSRFLAGSVPYRDFAVEYPPLALLPMGLPILVWPFGTPALDTYTQLFTLQQGGVAVVAAGLLLHASRRPVGALLTWSALVLAIGASMAWRYDLWPSVLVLGAVVAAQRGRPGLAGLAIGAGAMMKIFPIVLVPILLARSVALHDRPAIVRLLTGLVVATVPLMALTYAFAGPDAFHWLTYQLDRGLQIESLGSGVLLLLHALTGHPLSVVIAYSSVQIASPGADAIVALTPILELGLVLLVSGLAALSFRGTAARLGYVPQEQFAMASVAVLLAFLITSKVFSVQYVVWFLPLVPLIGVRQRWLAIAIAALSSVVYPLNYVHLWQLDPVMAVVLDVRNGLLVGLLAWLAAGLARGRRTFTDRRGGEDPADAEAGDTDRDGVTGLAGIAGPATEPDWTVRPGSRASGGLAV